MSLRRLSAHQFRNLIETHIELSPQLNIFYGANGSGKTSILEVVATLATGRSFRSAKYKTIINHHAEQFTLFGVVDPPTSPATTALGVQRNRQGEIVIRKSGQACRSATELAESLPYRLLNGHSFGLLEGAPEVRRQFLDWLVFHVEPAFAKTWKDYEKCVKHRNSLLRHDKIDELALAAWEQEMVPLAEAMDRWRADAFTRLTRVFDDLLGALQVTGLEGIALRYHRGWDREQPYIECLATTQSRDRELGYTRQGPHRADLRVLAGKIPAVETLSRGQQKILISALTIAQGIVFQQITGRKCIYLIDDLPAELDADFRTVLAQWLLSMNGQILVTGVDLPSLLQPWQDQPQMDVKVFHVEHGVIEPLDDWNLAIRQPQAANTNNNSV